MGRSKQKNKNKQRHAQRQRGQELSVTAEEDNPPQSPFRVAQSLVVGRCLEAARDLCAGEQILNEDPIVVGPSQDSQALCIGCYCSLDSSDEYSMPRCPKCGFPLCSSTCAGINKEYGHSVLECSIMSESVSIKKTAASELLQHLEAITPLRCLCLRSSSPETWDLLHGMEAHSSVRQLVPSLWSNNQSKVVDLIRKTWMLEKFEEEVIHHVCGVLEDYSIRQQRWGSYASFNKNGRSSIYCKEKGSIVFSPFPKSVRYAVHSAIEDNSQHSKVNAFEVGNGLRAVYPTAYLFAHDCVPNTRHTEGTGFNMTFWTSLPVKAGNLLTVTYTYILQGTAKRRKHLRDTKFFDCQCQRCSDPTELGTHVSAFLCPVCKHGLVECNRPLDQNSTWSCKNAQCTGYLLEGSTVDNLTQRIYTELDSIGGNDIPELEIFLEKYSNNLFSNHYLCLSSMHCLFLLYGKTEGYLITQLTEKQLLRKVEICQRLLDAFDNLEPGLSKQRGIILYELQAPLMVLLQAHYQERKIGKIEMKNRLRIISKYLEESHRILKVEPQGSQEAAMAEAAAEALSSLTMWNELVKRL